MKTLTSASATPYNVRAASTSPAALDIFAVQVRASAWGGWITVAACPDKC